MFTTENVSKLKASSKYPKKSRTSRINKQFKLEFVIVVDEKKSVATRTN